MLRHMGYALLVALVCAVLAGGVCAQMEPGLQDKINKAVEKGVEWLKAKQVKEGPDKGSWGWGKSPSYPGGGEPHKNMIGTTALSLFTLLSCEVPPDDPVIIAGLNYIHTQGDGTFSGKTIQINTYEAATLLMMYESLCISKLDQAMKKAGKDPKKDKKPPITLALLGEKEKVFVNGAVVWLKSTQTPDGGWRYGEPYFPAPQGVRQDVSATQIALLGLISAVRIGVSVAPQVFMKAAEYNVKAQEQDGPPAPSALSTSNDGKSTVMDKARGWAYANESPEAGEKRTSGSMTASGICSLIIAKSQLAKTKILTKELAEKVDRGIFDGLAWMNSKYSVTENPGGHRSHYYYLYGLERVGMLGDFKSIGMHNWYIDGAKYLVVQQKPDGVWDNKDEVNPCDVYCTCFALLFLKKATIPVGVTLSK
jgi:hypothetical protein